MEKNTILAIVLCAIIVVGSTVLQPLLWGQKDGSAVSATETSTTQTGQNNETVTDATMPVAAEFTLPETHEGDVVEETVVIETPEVRAVFSNRGGDIISYELLQHIDRDTGRGIEMVDNATSFNRACSMNIGGVDGVLLNGLFRVTREYEGDKQILLFTRNVSVENENGTSSEYVVGKRYTFIPGEYMFKFEVLLHGENGAVGINKNNAAYTIRTAPQMGPYFDQSKNRYEMRQFLGYDGKKVRRVTVGKNQFKQFDRETVWGGIAGKYFEELIVPEKTDIIETFYHSSRIESNDYANAQAFLVRKSFSQSDIHDTYYMYFGPREESALSRFNVAENNGWGLTAIRLNDSLVSSGWLSWLEKILKIIMEWLYKLTKNWGVAIIILTVLLKIAMFPLSRQQSIGTLKMQQIQPQTQALQEKYKDNPQKMQAEMQKLYKEVGYNPMSGCLPLLFQFLVLFAMFNLFNNYFEFRGASFIPGWIPDLSAGDQVYTFKQSLPFIGNQLHILPIIYLISQLLFGKITQMGGAAAGQSATQMKMMMYGMPIMFFFIFYNAPSGLLLYWTVSNVLQLVQQIIINNIMKNKKMVMTGAKKNNTPSKVQRKKK